MTAGGGTVTTDAVTSIGLGTMGRPMIENLARSVPVAVYSASLGLSPEVSRARVRYCQEALAGFDEESPDQSEIARYLAKATGVELTRT